MSDLEKELAGSLLEEYGKVYPDTTVTTMNVLDEVKISDKWVIDAALKLGKMTHTMPLYIGVSKESRVTNIKVYKSAEFLKNVEKMKSGTKVKYRDPRTPSIHVEGEIVKEGIHYEGGAACLWLFSEEAGFTPEDDVFAVFWRPVEEDKK